MDCHNTLFHIHPSHRAFIRANRFNRIVSIGSVSPRSKGEGFLPDRVNALAVRIWIESIGQYLCSRVSVRSLRNTPKVKRNPVKISLYGAMTRKPLAGALVKIGSLFARFNLVINLPLIDFILLT